WQWHQDYGTWKRDDGMPEPRAMNIAIFLDEVMPINGPLMLVPLPDVAGEGRLRVDLELMHVDLLAEQLLDGIDHARMRAEG
ncbi:phytanoyl-CoA dioxygenase family protein, partial [Bradyrhizobium brasilense]|uniref:phytanoyl-CoA dioxygenase family protein n=1 Tax=Bradyrhizobium brasilense TaxID=1419277 RepID=UPI003D3105EB